MTNNNAGVNNMVAALEGRDIRQPIVVPNLLNGQSIATFQAVFPLTEADFLRLQGGPPITSTLAGALFSGVLGYAISLGPRLGPLLSGQKNELTNGETMTLAVGAVAAALVYAAGFLFPNERKKVMSRISKHFSDAKTPPNPGAGAAL